MLNWFSHIEWDKSVFPWLELNQGFLTLSFGLLPILTTLIVSKIHSLRIETLTNRPYVTLAFVEEQTPKAMYLEIKNLGALPAYDVKVKAPDLARPQDREFKDDGLTLQEISWFTTEGISSLAPGQSFRTFYSVPADIDKVQDMNTLKSKVSIKYKDPNGKQLYTPEYNLRFLDMGDGMHLAEGTNRSTKALDAVPKISESLKTIAKDLSTATNELKDIALSRTSKSKLKREIRSLKITVKKINKIWDEKTKRRVNSYGPSVLATMNEARRLDLVPYCDRLAELKKELRSRKLFRCF